MCWFMLIYLGIVTPCWAARVVSREPPKVLIPGQGVLVGREVIVTRTQRAKLYLGIPFAEPPLNDLRFAPPKYKPLPSWSDDRNATYFQPACMQVRDKFVEHDRLKLASKLFPDEDIRFSEDCLYLNVYSPDGDPPDDGWPVLVWFHPGDFNVGAANLWDASVFAVKQKIIVVTPSYRLDIFGFFTTLDGHAPGNWGLLDQVAALDWVKNQIKEFGGQPDKIIIAGHSAGAISVGFHIVSSLSADYFVGAIGMSGSAFSPGVMKTQQQDEISNVRYIFSCNKDSPSLLTCLRRTNADVLLREASKVSSWGPVVDVDYVNETDLPFFTGEPFALFQNSRYNQVPLMVGYTDMEDALLFTEKNFNKDDFKNIITDTITSELPEPKDNDTCSVHKDFLIDSILFFYTPSAPLTEDMTVLRQKYIDFTNEKKYGSGAVLQASFVSKIKPVYLYRFDYRLKTSGICDLEDWMNVPHMCELPFVWGMPYWTSLSSQVVWNIADKKVADSVMSMWGNFTKFFNPSQNGRSVRWEQFSTDSPGILILDKNFNMSDPATFDFKSLSFWNDYYPKVIEASMCCNMTATGSNMFVSSSYLSHFIIIMYILRPPLVRIFNSVNQKL